MVPTPRPTNLTDALDRIDQLERENSDIREKFSALMVTHERLLRRIAFPRAETLLHHPDQRQLDFMAGLTPVAPVPLPPEPAPDQTEKRKPRRRGRGLRTLPDHLEVTEQRIELPEAERHDTDGSALVQVGEERSEKLDFIPGRFRKLIIVRVRYGRRDSRQPIVTAPLPRSIVERGLPTDELVLHVAHAKYTQALPLYRQRQEWLRHGVDLSVPTACSWMEHLSTRLDPVAGAIRQQVLSEPFLHLDDTPLKKLEPGRGRAKEARIWCYRGGGQVFYDFTDSRAGHWCQDLLRGYTGYVVCDAYSGHDRLFLHPAGAREVGCWAHARRPFFELHDRSVEALDLLLLIQRLYDIDQRAEGAASASADAHTLRAQMRSIGAPSVLATIRSRCESLTVSATPRSELGQAAAYVLNHWDALCRFLEAGFLPLDNNAAERALRPIAIGRKNWMFVASEDGGAWAATNLTIFQSCRQLDLDPITYLKAILPALHRGQDPMGLTPRSYTAKRIAA